MPIDISPFEGLYDEFGKPFRFGSSPVGGVDPNLPLPMYSRGMPAIDPTGIMEYASGDIAPNFSPIDIKARADAYTLSPAEEQLKNEKPPQQYIQDPKTGRMIENPEFQQSKARRILNAIAGGLAGVGHPEAGIKVGSYLHDRPYNIAKEDYDARMANLKAQLGQEDERFKQASKEIEEGVKAGTGEAMYGYRKRAGDIAYMNAQTRQADEQRKERHDAVYAKRVQAMIDNPKMTDNQFAFKLTPAERKDYIEMRTEIANGTRESIEQGVKRRRAYAEATQLGTADAQRTPEVQQAKQGISEAQAKGSVVGRTTAPLGTDEEAAVDLKVKNAFNNLDTAWTVAESIKDPRQNAAFWSRLGKAMAERGIDEVPAKVSGVPANAVYAAKTALSHINQIADLGRQADEAGILGPMMGRIAMIEQTIGGVHHLSVTDTGKSQFQPGTPERAHEDMLVAEIVAMQAYLTAFEAASVSGQRPAWQLISYLKGITPSVRMNRDMFEGSVRIARIAALNRSNAFYGSSYKGVPTGIDPKTGAPLPPGAKNPVQAPKTQTTPNSAKPGFTVTLDKDQD